MRDIFQAMSERMDLNGRLVAIDHLLTEKGAVERAQRGSSTDFSGGRYAKSIERAVASYLFLEWSGRQGAASPSQMRKTLGIEYVDGLGEYAYAACWYLEYAYNMVKLVVNGASKHGLAYNQVITRALQNDIEEAASVLGMTPVMLDEGRYHLCSNDTPVLAAAAVSADSEMRCFVEYLRFATRGDVSRKKELLASLYMDFEARRKRLEDHGNRKLASEIGDLVNNLGIRHNNTVGSKSNPVARTMSEVDLEGWYDYIFGLYAEAVLAEQRINKSPEVVELSKRLKLNA